MNTVLYCIKYYNGKTMNFTTIILERKSTKLINKDRKISKLLTI